jgi:ribosomal protein L37AE/L43A
MPRTKTSSSTDAPLTFGQEIAATLQRDSHRRRYAREVEECQHPQHFQTLTEPWKCKQCGYMYAPPEITDAPAERKPPAHATR